MSGGAQPGDVFEAPDGMRVRLLGRAKSNPKKFWIWMVTALGRDRRGQCPTRGGGGLDPSWKRLEAASPERS